MNMITTIAKNEAIKLLNIRLILIGRCFILGLKNADKNRIKNEQIRFIISIISIKAMFCHGETFVGVNSRI